MNRREFIRLVSAGIVALLLPFRVSTGGVRSDSAAVGVSHRFDILPVEDISGEPSLRNVRRILKLPVRSVEIVAPENPPWERIVVLARV